MTVVCLHFRKNWQLFVDIFLKITAFCLYCEEMTAVCWHFLERVSCLFTFRATCVSWTWATCWFKGHDEWIKKNKTSRRYYDLPLIYQKDWYIEAIDASDSNLIYEGLTSLRNLLFLKYLDVSYCPHVNAWFMDRITGEYADTLEYLDISGCKNLDWNGLEVIWRLYRLKILVMRDMVRIKIININIS